MIRSFGAKPVRGGSPPSDKRMSMEDEVKAGVLVQEEDSCEILVEFSEIRVENMADVIIIYKIKLNRVSSGLNFKIIIIQPR